MIQKQYFNKWFIVFAVIAAWFPIMGVPFVNDDFQILNYHSSGGLLSLLTPFWQSDISVYYWRPLGNMLHPLVLILFGFNPLPFRLLSVVLYIFCCFAVYKFIERSGVNKIYAIIGGILFAVLPAHEYQVAWIADQGESLVTILLLLTFITYKRYRLVATLCFIGAQLTKESAFTGIFIPLLYMALPNNEEKKSRYIKDSIIAFLILIGIQLYRYLVPGGSALSSSNFEGTGVLKWIINFFIYIPLSFIPPEFLDYVSSSVLFSLITILIAISLLYAAVRLFIKLPINKKRIFITGLLWFFIFILPALPKLMRWYVFTASAGLILSLSVLIQFIFEEKELRSSYSKPLLILTILFAVFFSIVTDITSMYNWMISGEKMKSITESLGSYKNADTLVIMCVPEKINNVPLMKLGILETVEYGTGKKIPVYAPLRCELFSDESSIRVNKGSDSLYIFTLLYGRFKSREGRASSYIKEENIYYSEDGYKIEITNGINRSSVSKARVYIPFYGRRNTSLYYNGFNFKSF